MKHLFQTKEGVVVCRAQHRDYKSIKRAIWLAIRRGEDTLVTVDTEREETLDLTDILQSRKLTL